MADGPIIDLFVFPPQLTLDVYKLAGVLVEPKKVKALIDTGAAISCICQSMADLIGLTSIESCGILTPVGKVKRPVYDINVAFERFVDQMLPVQAIAIDLTKQNCKVLLGRDILSKCTLIYNGLDNSYQLHVI